MSDSAWSVIEYRRYFSLSAMSLYACRQACGRRLFFPQLRWELQISPYCRAAEGPACCLGYPSRLRPPVERRCGLGLCPQVCCRLVEGHNDTVLCVHVEKAHPVANLEAVEAALLNNAYIEAIACRIHHCGPYAAAGGGTRHQHRINIHLVEVPDERGPKEATGPTLRNN